MERCPECGVRYPDAAPRPAETTWTGHIDDARLERRLRLLAPPIVLALAWLAMGSSGARLLSRIFLSMWVHELGHAVTAWMTGYWAIPGPWRTWIGDERSWAFALLVAAGLGGGACLVWWRTRRPLIPALLGCLLALQLCLTIGLRPDGSRALITFGGDAGLLVLGALGVASFYVPPGSALHRTWLRWGLLVIGAFALMDGFVTWGQAARDSDAIPFGELEGIGTTDPTRLVDDYGWTIDKLVSRYGALRWSCLAAVGALWVWSWLRGRASETSPRA